MGSGVVWLLVLMFVSASMSVDRRAARPAEARSSFDCCCRGLSGPGWSSAGVCGESGQAGGEIDADRRDATRCEPVCGVRGERRERSVDRNGRVERDLGGVALLELDGRDVAERAVQPVVVEPADVLRRSRARPAPSSATRGRRSARSCRNQRKIRQARCRRRLRPIRSTRAPRDRRAPACSRYSCIGCRHPYGPRAGSQRRAL